MKERNQWEDLAVDMWTDVKTKGKGWDSVD
jgi:hypothetical protein